MRGENFVCLVGKLTYPNFKIVGSGNKLFKARVAIPISGKQQYVKVGAWGSLAEALNDVPKDAFVKIHGHIEESSFDGKCRHCGGFDKKYWTEVLVDNFIVINEY